MVAAAVPMRRGSSTAPSTVCIWSIEKEGLPKARVPFGVWIWTLIRRSMWLVVQLVLIILALLQIKTLLEPIVVCICNITSHRNSFLLEAL